MWSCPPYFFVLFQSFVCRLNGLIMPFCSGGFLIINLEIKGGFTYAYQQIR